MRYALNGSRAGADNSDFLVAEFVQIPCGIAAGIAVIPAAGVERMPLVVVDTRNPRQLRPIQRPVGHDDEARAHSVAAVSGDDPPALFFAPGDIFDLSLKADVAI